MMGHGVHHFVTTRLIVGSYNEPICVFSNHIGCVPIQLGALGV